MTGSKIQDIFSLGLTDIPTSLEQIKGLKAVNFLFTLRVFYRTYRSYSGLTLVMNVTFIF